MKKEFYSNGKLLITGEYVVLDGAKALALPTRFGQKLIVQSGEDKVITWKSYDYDKSIWFEAAIPFENIITNNSAIENSIKSKLIEILHEAYKLNPLFIDNSNGYTINTELSFPRNWGLGTSSTLINNLAQWLEIDAFTLLKNSFGGSGYDIACAKNNLAIIYQLINEKPVVTPINFTPIFKENIFFVYLNRKQNSREAIANYLNNHNEIDIVIPKINAITEQIISNDDYKTISFELEKHESILSEVLELKTIKETFFDDFKGTIKSLGAWNGDFVMAISKENPINYFKERGFDTVLKYEEMIL